MPTRRAAPGTCVTRYDVPALPTNYSFAWAICSCYHNELFSSLLVVVTSIQIPASSPPARDSMTSSTDDTCTNDRAAVKGKWRS